MKFESRLPNEVATCLRCTLVACGFLAGSQDPPFCRYCKWIWGLSGVLLSILLGCQHPSSHIRRTADTAPPIASSDSVPEPSPDVGHVLPSVQSHAQVASDESSQRDGLVRLASLRSASSQDVLPPLTLSEAIAISLERNPDLVSARAGEAVAHAAFHVADTYPWNPQFQTQVLPYSRDPNGNDGAVSQQHVLVQTFELGGQQGYRRGAAAANWSQARNTIRQAELTNIAQTARLYVTAVYLKEVLEMTTSLSGLNQQLVEVLGRRQQAGQANIADVELARLQSQSSHRLQQLSEANYQTAIANLRTQLNLTIDAPLEVARDLEDWRWRPFIEILGTNSSREPQEHDAPAELDDNTLRRLVRNRPDVVAARRRGDGSGKLGISQCHAAT